MENAVENTTMQMTETTYMEMEDETERVMETILPMPTETIESPHHL